LRRAPGFALSAIGTLAIGFGAATGIFSMVNGVLLQRLPMTNGDRLMHLRQPSLSATDEGVSALEVADLRGGATLFSRVSEYHSMTFQLYGHGDPLRVTTGIVSDGFFDMLGVKAALGRTFRPGEEAVGAAPVVVLSHAFWMNQFHGDSSIVGATFTMNDRVHTVVGVLPSLPAYPEENDIWMPVGACPFRTSPAMANTRDHRMLRAFGLLKPGISPLQAAGELSTLAGRFHAEYPAAYPEAQRMRLAATAAREEMVARGRPILYMLFATAVFLLLVAVANVATLSVSRQLRRSRELAVRVALGGGGARLYRHLALESLFITAAAGALGLGIAASGVGLLRSLATRFTPRAGEISMSAGVLLFAIALSVVVALAIAAVPFLRARGRHDVAAELRIGNAGSGVSRRDNRVRDCLVVLQVALSFVMLVGAGLIGRSLLGLERADAGVDVHQVLSAQLELNFTKYDTPQKQVGVAQALLQGLDALPGVSSMALASASPLRTTGVNDVPFRMDRGPTPTAGGAHAEFIAVSPEYFRTVGVPLLRGRAFTLADRDTANVPAIISERLVREYWAGRDPIGTRITADSAGRWLTVVGVAGNVRHRLADADVVDAVYIPVATTSSYSLEVFLRSTGPLQSVEQELRAAVHEVDPQQPVSGVQTLEQARGAQLAEPRLTTTLVVVFAVLALALAATGLWGVVAYGVAQRLPEIGIRVALGATPSHVLASVMREGLLIIGAGLAVGFGAALAMRGMVEHLLVRVGSADAPTYTGVAVMLLVTAAFACLLPSWRALKADPARVLRG
jgi:predicted permease